MEEHYPKSDINCQSCRRRKTKCGRELPHCIVCQQASQVCEYPARILKPGPKLGSTHQNRKRRRREESTRAETSIVGSSNASSTNQEDTGMAMSSSVTSASPKDDFRNAQERPAAPRRKHTSSLKETRTSHESINIQDLSFILHPAHEPSMSEENTSPNSIGDGLGHDKWSIYSRASNALDVAPDVLDKMVKIYFHNMTAINIFHEPSFEEKILGIGSSTQSHALLASILAFSARFCTTEANDAQDFNVCKPAGMNHQPAYFLDLASRLVEEILRDCDDEEPPLCVLQAQILIAHGRLTQGVRGKAWRSLGTCVRLAYALNLHLVDAGPQREAVDAKLWVENEEKRRAWWAIWEMDVFASTVRRYPTAVNWSQIETLLPIEDEFWFQGKPRASCFLHQDLVLRWKMLQESGNQSAKAWFIVINSFMKEAQSISSPRSVPNLDLPHEKRALSRTGKDKYHEDAVAKEARERLETLSNCVRCFVMALPPSLKYRNQYLSFDERKAGEMSSLRQNHCGLYNIHVMIQLAKLMIHHYDVFTESGRVSRSPHDRSSRPSVTGNTTNSEISSRHQYFEAADEISRIVSRSSDDHIQHINAFLASTVWLASAVQLVRRKFGPLGTNQSLVKSKFEVLNMIYKKCVSFWGIQNAMQQNLETLESQLESFSAPPGKKLDRAQPHLQSRPHARMESWENGSLPNVALQNTSGQKDSASGAPLQHDQQARSTLSRPNNPRFSDSSIPSHYAANNLFALHSSIPSQYSDDQDRPRVQTPHGAYVEPLSPALSSFDFMHLSSHTDKNQQQSPEGYMDGTPPSFMQDQGMFSEAAAEQHALNPDGIHGEPFGMYENGWNSYINNLLSGACQY